MNTHRVAGCLPKERVCAAADANEAARLAGWLTVMRHAELLDAVGCRMPATHLVHSRAPGRDLPAACLCGPPPGKLAELCAERQGVHCAMQVPGRACMLGF